MATKPATSAWGDDLSDDDNSDQQRLLSGPQKNYHTTQEQYIREHEEGLDKLGEAIKRQKYMANELATEVDVQNEIIEDIDTGLTRTSDNLRKNVRNIKLVSRKSSTLYLWLLIIILGLVIVGLTIL